MPDNLLEKLFSDRPMFHASETEIQRSFDPSESKLNGDVARYLSSGEIVCYGIHSDVLRFLAESTLAGFKTLETGAGLTTLVFAIKGATHIAITPNPAEIERIRQYANENGINLDAVIFAPQSSDEYLPQSDAKDLDIVLLDGKHAFPWPMVDWFYTADRLKKGGLMVIDDAEMRSVSVLCEFMQADPGWKQVRNFEGKTLVFAKICDSFRDVAWHMQPWTLGSYSDRPQSSPLNLPRRVKNKVARLMGRR